MKVPLVGVWFYGLDWSTGGGKKDEDYKTSLLVNNPYVWASLVRFLSNNTIVERISPSQGKKVFLIVNFCRNSSSP
jgi:hypothetical protein